MLVRSNRRPSFLVRWVARAIARLYLRRPELEDVIAIRYRTTRGLAVGIGNELAYRFGWSRVPGLLSLNLELTNHCNLKCSFCPTGNGLMLRPRGFMDPDAFEAALRGAGPLEFVLLFQWGESLLHPQFAELAQRARAHGARTLVTTNGTLLDRRRVDALLDAGLDRVTVSVDGDAETHEAIRGVPLQRTLKGLELLVEERDRRAVPTAIDVSMVISPETESAAEQFRETYEEQVDRVQQIPLLTKGTRRTRCREPWRSGPVVLQDGRVTVCCVDHDGALSIGHVGDAPVRDLWNGPAMRAFRRAHVTGQLPPICASCTEYPTDDAAPRFSSADEASTVAPHRQNGNGA
ncbi:MAG: radical SAM protein [Planctomycetota bacterium]|nr:radical SAM protein [Planctomycetota bacterium]